MNYRLFLLGAGLGYLAALEPSQAAQPVTPASSWPRYVLKAEMTWQLDLPEGKRFDASGLLLTSTKELLTLNDRGLGLYRIGWEPGTPTATLTLLPDCFSAAQVERYRLEKRGHYDNEGIAQDAQGRLYICEEANRWILRWDPATQRVDRLDIDWTPVRGYFSSDRNASFEGIAVGGNRLYVANERQTGRIIAVDLNTLKVIDHFTVRPHGVGARDVHYTDLCWRPEGLFVLLRESSIVLKVDPLLHRVLAEYSFASMERQPEVNYYTLFPTSTMEGLTVDDQWMWLLTDNNGLGRIRYKSDIRPTLFRCPRPDLKESSQRSNHKPAIQPAHSRIHELSH